MVENFIDSALIIDDKEDEVAALKQELEKREIWHKHHLPKDLKGRTIPFRSCKLIFLDLHIEEDKDTKTNIAIIRKLFTTIIGKKFGNYGIVLLSKHVDEINELKTRMGNDAAEYNLPLFIVGVDKGKYLRQGHYDDLMQDINLALENDIAANFFIYWDNLVDKGKVNSIRSIYSLVPDYTKLEQDLKFILHKLALNHTGIPQKAIGAYALENDAVKAISDMLSYEIIHEHKEVISLFANPEQITFSGTDVEKSKVFASLNSRLFLDFKNIDQTAVIPGNVYEILDKGSFFGVAEAPAGAIKILIEITPPCDFSADKKVNRSRVMGGFYLTDFDSKNQKEKFSKENYYKELDGLIIDEKLPPQKVRFDFRYFGSINEADLKDIKQYKLIFRFKDKLFADILQKLSSHIARLGLPYIK